MKLGGQKKGQISSSNEERLLTEQGAAMDQSAYFSLLVMISQMYDQIAAGRDMYMILGATSNKTAFTCTIKDAGAPTTVFGQDLTEVCFGLEDLL